MSDSCSMPPSRLAPERAPEKAMESAGRFPRMMVYCGSLSGRSSAWKKSPRSNMVESGPPPEDDAEAERFCGSSERGLVRVRERPLLLAGFKGGRIFGPYRAGQNQR